MSIFDLFRGSRVMVLAPHPDDETLATGGLLQRAVQAGSAVRVVFITGGDNNPWPQRFLEHRWRLNDSDRARWGALRRREALAAMQCLGVPASSAVFLEYPDQGLTSVLLDGSEDRVLQLLGEQIAGWRPTVLVYPSLQDAHPDHSALGTLVTLVLNGFKQPPGWSMEEITYIIHPPRNGLSAHEDVRLRLSAHEQERKREAVLSHRSQIALSRSRLMAFAGDSERYLKAAECKAAAHDPCHPIYCAEMNGADSCVLSVIVRNHVGSFGKAELCLLLYSSEALRTSYRIRLPGAPSHIPVLRSGAGRQLSQAYYRGNARKGRLILPASLFQGARMAFVKLSRRFGFFDEAGWREIPVPHYDRQRTG